MVSKLNFIITIILIAYCMRYNFYFKIYFNSFKYTGNILNCLIKTIETYI